MSNYKEFDSISGTAKYICKSILGAAACGLVSSIFSTSAEAAISSPPIFRYSYKDINKIGLLLNATINCLNYNGTLLYYGIGKDGLSLDFDVCIKNETYWQCNYNEIGRYGNLGSGYHHGYWPAVQVIDCYNYVSGESTLHTLSLITPEN